MRYNLTKRDDLIWKKQQPQISLTGGIPFAVTLPNAPSVLKADLMAAEEIHKKLQEGYGGNQYAIVEKGHGTKYTYVQIKF